MSNYYEKVKTKQTGVYVTGSIKGGFNVLATAQAVKAWPWDNTSWPCSSLNKSHLFTFDAVTGDLCDLETKQKDDESGENGLAVEALADDCKTIALETLKHLDDLPTKYKVTYGKAKRFFNTIEEADLLVKEVFEKTKVFLSIETYKGKVRCWIR